MPLLPDTETVTKHWLLSLPEIPANSVSTTLPADTSTWATNGYIVIRSITEDVNTYTTLRLPVVQLEFYAVNPDSGIAPWWKANDLAERVVSATLPTYPTNPFGQVTLPPDYGPARVLNARVIRAPFRKPGDQGSYAVYQLDLALDWVRI